MLNHKITVLTLAALLSGSSLYAIAAGETPTPTANDATARLATRRLQPPMPIRMPIRCPRVVMVERPTMGRCLLPPSPAPRVNRPVAAVGVTAVVNGYCVLKSPVFRAGLFFACRKHRYQTLTLLSNAHHHSHNQFAPGPDDPRRSNTWSLGRYRRCSAPWRFCLCWWSAGWPGIPG